MPPTFDRRGFLWTLFAVFSLACIGLFFVPAFVIQPFKHQTARGLALAMALHQRAPWGTLAAAVVSLGLALVLWSDRTPGKSIPGSVIWANMMRANRTRTKWWITAKLWRRIAIGLVMVLVVFSTVMARLNYFEWMFHPVPGAQFESEATSKLDKGEMILAVRLGGDARAYPISEMAYHHIVNDVVNGVPICATY
jgi:Protein of unknown function (DUF3179)